MVTLADQPFVLFCLHSLLIVKFFFWSVWGGSDLLHFVVLFFACRYPVLWGGGGCTSVKRPVAQAHAVFMTAFCGPNTSTLALLAKTER